MAEGFAPWCRPPQQKFTSFEEYMNAHGGATAPIEDHSEEV